MFLYMQLAFVDRLVYLYFAAGKRFYTHTIFKMEDWVSNENHPQHFIFVCLLFTFILELAL